LSDRSRGLIQTDDLAVMKPTAYLINIAGAGLDVYDTEPPPAAHPLRSMRNTLLPHIGYVTTDGYRTWFGQVAADILAWTAGTPIRAL
jgi:phosphoglycerate dehydrogenase-like enzyme